MGQGCVFVLDINNDSVTGAFTWCDTVKLSLELPGEFDIKSQLVGLASSDSDGFSNVSK